MIKNSMLRVQKYLDLLATAKRYNQECIHSFLEGGDTETPLLVSDLKALLQFASATISTTTHPSEEARIAELEAQLSAIGAGGVEPLRKRAAAPHAVQAAVPEAIEQMAADRYKVVPSHESMFHRWAVVADNGTQHLYIGRDGECQNMARKFMGAFLDGAFAAMQNAAAPQPPEVEIGKEQP